MEASITERHGQRASTTPLPKNQESQSKATTTLTKKNPTGGSSNPHRVNQAAATLKRAWEIAARGMFKEAVLLWEHATRLGSEIQPPPETLLTWMINSQQFNKAIHFFTANEAAIRYNQPQLWNTARELFAVASLTADPDINPLPPWNAPPWHHAETARNALNAFCRKEQHAMLAYLAPIEPNSPFRPFRRILESLLLPVTNPEAIDALLHNIPDSSPFAPLRAMARARILTGEALATTLLNLSPVARIPVTLLCGVEEKQLKLLLRLGQTNPPGQQVALLLAHADLLPPAPTRAACMDLLPECLEERGRFEKRFGPLKEFERERLFALHHERQKSFSRALTYWKKCLLLLENGANTRENRIRIALLYQRLAFIEQQYASPSTAQIIEYLEKSLNIDPDDQKTWLALLHWRNRLKRDRQPFLQLADKAARRFPRDEEILPIALAAAMEKGAFKKAAGLARQLQKCGHPPVDLQETRLLALTRHARKLILEGLYVRARKELARTAAILPEKSRQVCLLSAMLEFLDGDLQQGDSFLEEGRSLARREVEYAVRAFLEAVTLSLPPLLLDRFRHTLIQCDATPPNREEALAIADIVTDTFPHHPVVATEIMALLAGHFRKAAVLVYN
ncbi:MAG: hypothetical protein HQM02_08200, partial [Magnetococcales bacterium]|nr:hypothetical protein [Magnetococcales bacterium]